MDFIVRISHLENSTDALLRVITFVQRHVLNKKKFSSQKCSVKFAWKIPWTAEPGSPWGHRVRRE